MLIIESSLGLGIKEGIALLSSSADLNKSLDLPCLKESRLKTKALSMFTNLYLMDGDRLLIL